MNTKNTIYHLLVLSGNSSHSIERTIPLAEAGHKITFIANTGVNSLEKLKEFPNISIKFFEEIFDNSKFVLLPTFIEYIRKLKPDAIIIHFCAYASFHAAIMSGVKPIIGILMGADVDIHDTKVPLHVRLEIIFTKMFVPYIEFLSAKTKKIENIVRNWRIKGKVVNIPWGVKIKKDQSLSIEEKKMIRRTFKLPENDWLVLSSRKLTSSSQVLEIIEGFHKFLGKVESAFLIIIKYSAANDYLDEVIKKVKDLNLFSKVKFLPPLKSEELKELYSVCDVLVSNRIYDGMPQTFFEAGLIKTPILSSSLPHYHDYFRDGISMVFCDGSAESIALKLEWFYRNKFAREKMSEEARKDVIAKADFDKWASYFRQEMINVIENKKRIRIPKFRLFLGKILLFFIYIARKFPFSKISIKI